MLIIMSTNSSLIPPEVGDICLRLGQRIRTARLLRNWRQVDLVSRTGYARNTILKVEKGDPGTSLGTYLHILWVMGLAGELELIADPGLDRGGLSIALDAASKRAYLPRKIDDDF